MKLIEEFTTIADRGGVLIGNEKSQFLIPNTYGDGTIEVEVYQRDDIFDHEIPYGTQYFTVIEGINNVYGYDCRKDLSSARHKLHGQYSVYIGELKVVFVKSAD